MRRPDYPKIMFLLSCILGAFAYGLVVAHYKVFPYSIISYTKDSVEQVFADKETLLGLRPTEFLEPARDEGSGVTRLESDQVVPGLTFLTSFFDDGNEMRLIRSDGSVVNRWRVKYFDMFPDPQNYMPADKVPNSEWNVAVHGSYLLPDGSVVFNFNSVGTAKIDRCGKVLWTIPDVTHHAVFQSLDGGFWIPSLRFIEDVPQYPHLKAPYVEDTIIKVSADGEVLRELSVLEILFKNNLQGLIYKSSLSGDLIHVNDVEELDADMAVNFPQFDAGDLLISARFPRLVMVVEPETLEVKWYQVGPWIGQHDPDFMETGRISVFSNNNQGSAPERKFGGSSVMEVDPADRSIHIRFGVKADEPLFTKDRGDHQRLGDGGRSILITETQAGRVFEVNQDNRVVWEFINRYDADNVTIINNAARYPENYFTVADWSCPKSES